MSEPHDADGPDRVSSDELANYMAGALTRSEEEALARRIEKDPEAPELLKQIKEVDGTFRAAYPASGPQPEPSEPMPLLRAARIHAALAGEALARFDSDHLRSTPYLSEPDLPGTADDGESHERTDGAGRGEATDPLPTNASVTPGIEPGTFSVEGIDFDRPNAARMYDYFLGGSHNFAADREQAERVITSNPRTCAGARANRVFLANAVRWCLSRGITQFLDLGSGVPTAGNVHEVAQAVVEDARVAYVDFEPVAVTHARQLISDQHLANVTVTRADIREPRTVVSAPRVAGFLDFTRPVAILMVAVLHFVDEDGDALDQMIRRYLDAVVPGSAIVISHTSDDQDDPTFSAQLRDVLNTYRHSSNQVTYRSRARLQELLADLEIAEPGLVDVADWPTPGVTPGPAGAYGVVGVVPERSALHR